MNRRSFITGLAGIFAAGVAPAVLSQGSIMRIKPLILPGDDEFNQAVVAGRRIGKNLLWTDYTDPEILKITQRAFAQNLVVQLYKDSPLMSRLLADAKAKGLGVGVRL